MIADLVYFTQRHCIAKRHVEGAMAQKLLLAASLALVTLAPRQSQAGVAVHFIDPARYTDAGSFGSGSQEAILAEFRSYFQQLGARFLAPGQTLAIDVLNIRVFYPLRQSM